MWGNSVDLSIVRDIEAINTVNNALPSTLESTKTLDSLIILNHIKEASQYMYNNRNKRVDIILDNSGKRDYLHL